MVRGMPRRPLVSLWLLVVGWYAFKQGALLMMAFAVPAPSGPTTGVKTGCLTGASLPALELDAKMPRASPVRVARTMVCTAEAIGLAAVVAAIRAWLMPARTKAMEPKPWDARRFWTALNVANHAIYAALFIIRSFFYTGVGSTDRPFYYESFFLGWLCGPSALLPTLLGWSNQQYHQPVVLKWMTAINAPTSTAYPAWITYFIGNPLFMYYYQIAEGLFHFMIVMGGMRAFVKKAWPPVEGEGSLKLFRWGLWLELVIMDIAYVVAYSCLPMLSVPGHWGLTTIMMLIHHLNVLPDVVCAWEEWKAARVSGPLRFAGSNKAENALLCTS